MVCDISLTILSLSSLQDDLARAGYLVVGADYFRGDPSPSDLANPNFNRTAWSLRHTVSDVDSIITNTISYLRNTAGVKRIGAVGYCFGGRYVARFLAAGKGVDAGFFAHPSLLTIDEAKNVSKPISVAGAEVDTMFPDALRREVEGAWRNRTQPYQISLYGGTSHGFGVRANLSDPRQKYAKEEAYLQAVRFFDTFLKV